MMITLKLIVKNLITQSPLTGVEIYNGCEMVIIMAIKIITKVIFVRWWWWSIGQDSIEE